MSKPTLEEMLRICEAEYGGDMIQKWPWVHRSLERISILLETQGRCEERVRDAVKFGMRRAYSWTCNELDTSPEAFERFVCELTGPNPPAFTDGSPEPTPEAVAAFNARQIELRKAYLAGYEDTLPEHRAEGVEKAARRFPLKRLVGPPESMPCGESGITMQTVRHGDGEPFVEFKPRYPAWLSRTHLLSALALLDAKRAWRTCRWRRKPNDHP